jgi:hypothetical protein
MFRKTMMVLAALAVLGSAVIRAEDKGGFRVEVSTKTLDRNDGRNDGYTQEIDRLMTLKLKTTNISMKPALEQSVEYVIIVQRWGASEQARYDRITGTASFAALPPTKDAEVTLGEYRIGGHLHGTSRRHLDELAGWKLKFIPANLEFRNTSQFDTLEKRALSSQAR